MSSSFLLALLNHYRITLKDLEERNLPRSFANLKRPSDSEQFRLVISRLEKAIKTKEKTVIYGDYDVDGLTSTAILKMGLDSLGLQTGFFTPSRYIDGYGLTSDKVRLFAQKGYKLIITVDNGISQKEQIALAKSLGMEVVVIDHHEVPSELPDTPYIFHQTLSSFIPYNCSAASLAYFVIQELTHEDNLYYALLAGIAVFSDVMPLVGNNLVFARIMLREIQSGKYDNLSYILRNANVSIPDTSYDDISFTLIPSLNSVGRIRRDALATNNACRYLISYKDPKIIQAEGNEIISCNEERKNISKNVKFLNELNTTHAKVVITDSFSGVSGLIAGRLFNQEKKCIAVFSASEDKPEELVGSIRVPDGYAVDGFIHSHMSDFITAGGHEKASGLTIRKADFYKIATLFMCEMEKQALEAKQATSDDISIVLEDLNQENFNVYSEFMPFGEGFRAPVFSVTVRRDKAVRRGKAAFVYGPNGAKVTCFSSLEVFDDPSFESITCRGVFRKETFNGNVSYVLLCNEAKGNIDASD